MHVTVSMNICWAVRHCPCEIFLCSLQRVLPQRHAVLLILWTTTSIHPMPILPQDHKYFHRPAKGAQQRGYRGKIMNTMMTYLIKYPFQQKRDGGTQRVRERSKLRDCRSSGESGWIKRHCLPGITGKYFTISWTSDTAPLICKMKSVPLNPNKEAKCRLVQATP